MAATKRAAKGSRKAAAPRVVHPPRKGGCKPEHVGDVGDVGDVGELGTLAAAVKAKRTD